MQPIFNEQIKMWSDLGYPLPIEEGTYWYDNHFICAFDMGGVRHKLYRYKVFDDLSIEIKPYEKCKSDIVFETWYQTVSRMSKEINEKSSHAMSVICKATQDYPQHKKVVFTSTGKDSMVVLDLVKHILPNIEVYFNNTSLDTGDTYKMAKQHKDWTIINPEIGFYQYVKQARFIPTRFSRGCCTLFKEGTTIEYFNDEPQMLYFMGVRNEESNARADRQDISHNPRWGNRDWFSCLPIQTWNEFDVWLYILKRKLEINPKYRKATIRKLITRVMYLMRFIRGGQYDLLIGGSPCVYWSLARTGKYNNGIKRETKPEGYGWELFTQYLRALKEVKPKYFLYENNVSMSDEIKDCISKELKCEPYEIDSADFSAQNRKRYYWTNIPILPYEKSTLLFCDIEDKENNNFMIRSIEQYADTIKWSTDGKCVKWDTSGKGYYSQANRARTTNQKWNTVCANRAESKGDVWLGNNMVRHLTMSELEKLQTLPVGYTACLKNKEMRGKCIGNGWTVDVIAHIFKGLKEMNKNV